MKKSLTSLAPLASLAIAVALAAPALSESRRPLAFASDNQTLPVVVNRAGLGGATFQTYVALMNPTSKAFPVRATLYDASGVATTKTITLAAGELKTYSNFLDSVFSLTGAGAVTFVADDSTGGTHNNRFILSAEVHTNVAGTRFGTTVPALEFAGSDSRSFAAGINADAGSRTNVGCFNQAAAANVVKASVFDAAGALVTTVNLALAAHAWGQAGVVGSVTNGYVRFEPQDAAVCYAVVVDNNTNDGRFISAVEYAP